jgi:hypothetical protein
MMVVQEPQVRIMVLVAAEVKAQSEEMGQLLLLVVLEELD